ncbi:MAG: hypothetical protein K2M91_15160 [Lachnospiraceae bacterium]|nr:hypothetical protein [Lachnospiraceae bacterium]
MRVNQYQFENICRQMEQEVGKIKKGEENNYLDFLFPMESNLLKTHRTFPASNSHRLLEAIPLALFQLKSNMTGEEYDLEKFKSEDNEKLVHALLMSFDPFTNEEIKAAVQKSVNILEDKDALKIIYGIPIMCMLRIKESVETFGKHLGANGYFDFLEENIGVTIPQDEELNGVVIVPDKNKEVGRIENKKGSLFGNLFKKR